MPGARMESQRALFSLLHMKATGVFCVVPICGLAAFPIR